MFKRQIEKAYKELFGSRCDDPGYKHYFTYKDFPPMKEEAISFISQDTNTLRGGLYYDKESIDDYDKLVIFCHGMGGGYLAYMSEINMLVKNGFLVLAYDYTGTFSSDGESLKGFTLPLLDLQYCHKFIKENERLRNKELMIIGHSWGGFTALNSLNMFDDITHAVAISAPLSLKSIIRENLKILYPIFKYPILRYEAKMFGKLAYLDGMKVIKSDTKLLSVYSLDDDIVLDKYNYLPLRKKDKNKNHQEIVVKTRKHNPTHANESVPKLYDLSYRINEYIKQGKTKEEINTLLSDVNWKELIIQDEIIWNKIVTFLNN